MKAIILAAGYSKGLHTLAKDLSTALLPIRGRPAIEFLLEKILVIPSVEEIFIVVNERCFLSFQAWLDDYVHQVPIRLINNGLRSHKGSLGAASDLAMAVEKGHIDDDIIIAGADNMFSFSLADFMRHAFSKKSSPLIAVYGAHTKQKLKRYGIVKVDESRRVVDFCEKPLRRNGSNLISACLYFLPKEKLPTIRQFLSINTNGCAIGDYIKWLSQNDAVFTFEGKGDWFDIGDDDSYAEAIFKF